jgi:hypothetical protein
MLELSREQIIDDYIIFHQEPKKEQYEAQEKEIQENYPDETWVDANRDVISIGDWVNVMYKTRVNDKWEDHSFEAKIIDILPADGDWDDENNRPISIPSQVLVEYVEDGVEVEELLDCEYEYYENTNICHDITIKEF